MPTTRYPWGTASPATRIRETSTKARNGLNAAAEATGIDASVASLKTAAMASQPLTETLDYLSRAGLRTRGEQDPLDGSVVADAVQALHQTLGELAVSTPSSLSGCYTAYVAALEALLSIADDALARGIARSGAVPATDPWGPFSG